MPGVYVCVMAAADDVRTWLDGIAPGQFRALFDHLPGAMFFAKDAQLRLVLANRAFVARCGFAREADIVGRTDEWMFPPRLAAKYRRDDLRVLATGEPLLGLVELFPDAVGRPGWAITDKLPVRSRDGTVCGVCGLVRSYAGQAAAIQPYLELAGVAEHLQRQCREPLDVARLAKLAKLSVRQFERKFRSTFQTSPRGYLMQMRVARACELLAASKAPLTEIALAVGFYDHSDFARQFKKHIGQSPGAWRRGRLAAGRTSLL